MVTLWYNCIHLPDCFNQRDTQMSRWTCEILIGSQTFHHCPPYLSPYITQTVHHTYPYITQAQHLHIPTCCSSPLIKAFCKWITLLLLCVCLIPGDGLWKSETISEGDPPPSVFLCFEEEHMLPWPNDLNVLNMSINVSDKGDHYAVWSMEVTVSMLQRWFENTAVCYWPATWIQSRTDRQIHIKTTAGSYNTHGMCFNRLFC